MLGNHRQATQSPIGTARLRNRWISRGVECWNRGNKALVMRAELKKRGAMRCARIVCLAVRSWAVFL